MQRVTYLLIDIETFSEVDLEKSGVYPYAESKSFRLLLFSYSRDGGPVQTLDIASGQVIPPEIVSMLSNPDILKVAHNSIFERTCLSCYLGLKLSPEQWLDTMVLAASLGLPSSLDDVGKALRLPQQKLGTGHHLLRYFSRPCKATKANGGRTRNLPSDNPVKWSQFVAYNQRDVEVAVAVFQRLQKYAQPVSEHHIYWLDQRINDRGVQVDMALVNHAVAFEQCYRQETLETARKLTGLENPNSAVQLKKWLSDQGIHTDSLKKTDVAHILETSGSGEASSALKLRQTLSKSSVSKYVAMKYSVCADGRIRGLFQFYGANRTGRWAGRLVQVQNLPQNHMPDLDEARNLVLAGDYGAVSERYPSVMGMLSELIRTAFIPRDGCLFYVADFAAIEARVLAWLAGEKWRQNAFAAGTDIYCASASQMFGVPVVKNGINGELRKKGKIAELALGYGGNVQALKNMGALEMGLKEEELSPLVTTWRASNPCITRLWSEIEGAAKECLVSGKETETHGLRIRYQNGVLFILLPSGRNLAYPKPNFARNSFGAEVITFMGTKGKGSWSILETYGPKLTENVVQAISRDILAEAMLRLDAEGFEIVMHIHDEVVIEAPPTTSLEKICSIMAVTPDWAEGLLLRADGYTCKYYKKE